MKWIQKHGWKFAPKTLVATSRADMAKQWGAFLINFSEIEDVRFKLCASCFENAAVPLSILLDEKGNMLKVFGGWSKQKAEGFEKLARPH